MTQTSDLRLRDSGDLDRTGAERRTAIGRGHLRRARRRTIMRLVAIGAVGAGAGLGVVGVAFPNAPSAPTAAAAKTKTIYAAVAAGKSGATSQQKLLRTLDILRASPTAGDRAVIACVKRTADKYGSHPCLRGIANTVWIIEHPAPVADSFLASLRYPKLDTALIRTVRLRGSEDSVRFFPLNWRSSPPSAPRTWGVVVGLLVHGDEETEVFPTSVGTLRARGIALFPQLLYVGRPKKFTVREGAIVVPDGVARITVATVSLGGGVSVRENVTAAVRDNVAAVPLKTPTFKTSFGFGPESSLRMTWFDSRGNVVGRATNALWTSGLVSPQ